MAEQQVIIWRCSLNLLLRSNTHDKEIYFSWNSIVGKAVTTVTTKSNAIPNAASTVPVETIVSVTKGSTATAT